jgi:hypothetical protein
MVLFISGVIVSIKDIISVAIGELLMMDTSVLLIGCVMPIAEDYMILKDGY